MNRDWPPIELYSVHFQFPGSQALPLVDPVTNEVLGARPEWIKNARNEPVAYERGSTPEVRVGLMTRFLFVPDRFTLYAETLPLDSHTPSFSPDRLGPWTIESKRAQFSEVSKTLAFNWPLPDRIGVHTLKLRWFAAWKSEEGEDVEVVIGDTQHTVCTTGKRPASSSQARYYAPLMLWTSDWCAGVTGDKEICDAILKNLPATNLRYGVPGWDVRYMLMTGGGMCGGWYQLFQQMAACQGVRVETRSFRPVMPPPLAPDGKGGPGPLTLFAWGAFSCCVPGVNQLEPSWIIRYRGLFPQAQDYPPDLEMSLDKYPTQLENRYCYPIDGMDGHSINFLVKDDGKTVYLYDACFRREAVELAMPLPAVKSQMQMGRDAPFRSQYLDGQFIWFLAGGLMGGQYSEVNLDERLYGLSVKTHLVPELAIEWDY
jgi:hypothetical protein